MKPFILILGSMALALGVALAHTPPATTRATDPADRTTGEMNRLLAPSSPGGQPLRPTAGPQTDKTSGVNAVAPGAPSLNVLREGTLIVDRVGRIQKSPNGQQLEFVFDSDGKSMQDPPIILLPNLKLMAIENELSRSDRELKFRISGSVTEYRGRNYILLDKVVVLPDAP